MKFVIGVLAAMQRKQAAKIAGTEAGEIREFPSVNYARLPQATFFYSRSNRWPTCF